MSQPTVELKSLNISFADVELLKEVNLEVQKQESFVIVGPSGQGKTVLLKLMSGLLEPTKGQVLIESNDLNQMKLSEKDQLMRKMDMLFQKNALFDSLTCAENIAFPMREVTKATEKEIEEKIDFFLNAVDIPHAKNLFPDEISGGMQKRLGIARALALDPQIIFYDDPTAGLDPITSRKIIRLILDLKDKNQSTVVTVINDMNRAFQMADRIGMVVDGELIITGSVEETKNHSDPRVQQFIHGSTQGPLTQSSSDTKNLEAVN